MTLLNADAFRSALRQRFRCAEGRGDESVEVEAGDLHRDLGGYPDPKLHRMPVCCDVMLSAMGAGDHILNQPPKRKGASLRIRYALPRGR